MEGAIATNETQQAEPAGEGLSRLVEWYEDAEDSAQTAVRLANRDRDYKDNKQLTQEEIATLNARGQPDLIFNVIQPKIDYLVGFEASNRTDPRGFPRTPNDEDAAAACTDALRYVKDEQELDQKFSTAWENMLVEGYGGIELVADGEGDISAKEWEWSRLFHDPHSRKPDFSDARYLGGVVWMDLEQAKEQWPEKADDIETNCRETTALRHDDKPSSKTWTTGSKRRRVRIVQMYYKTGQQWYWAHFTKGVMLDGGAVPFLDKKGRSFCPLIMQSAYVDRENNRYGFVRFMISPQDEVNKRRSKSLHLIMQRQTLGEAGAVDDVDMMKAEMSKPDGHVEINPGFRFEVLDTKQMVQGNFELLQQALTHMQSIGPNSAMLGKINGGDPSGRAILANQSGGQTELARLLDRHRHLKRRVYDAIWNLIRQYKTAEWWVRVTDDENNVKFVGMNRPVTQREELMKRVEEARANGAPEEELSVVIQQMQNDPTLDQVVRIENVPAEMDMDIILEEVPDVANVASEQFEGLIKLAPAVTFPPEIYIQASSLRNKKELIDKLKQPPPDPMRQAVEQRSIEQQIRRGDAEIAKIEAQTIGELAKADQTDAQTGQIVNPAIVQPGQMQPQQQTAFQ